MHSHKHSHTDSHDHHPSSSRRRLFWSFLLIGGFVLVEVIGGILSGSLALLADAAHMLTDTVSLLLAWLAFRFALRPADKSRTYGYHRFPVLAAFANAVSLFFILGWILVKAVERLANPIEVLAGHMLVVAVIGLVVNIVVFVILHGADRSNLNIRGALLHVLGDLLGSAAAILGALVILTTGWTPIDPLLSLLIVLIVLRSAWTLLKESSHVLLEGVPSQLNLREIGQDLVSNIEFVEDIHHLHAWSLSQDQVLVTLHARISENTNPDSAIARIQNRLTSSFGVNHATIQIELHDCVDDSFATIH